MKVIEPGHVYILDEVDNPPGVEGHQTIRFVRRRDSQGEIVLGDLERYPGILTQELLRVAIDRTLYLYAEAPCDEDTEIIECLRRALTLYESRASRRVIEKLAKPEEADVCSECGHILCNHG